MAKKLRKALAILLALTMAVSLVSITALAGEKTDAANGMLAEAQTALTEAQAALDAAKAVQTAAREAYDAAKPAYDETVAAIDKTALTDAEAALETAKTETAAAQAAADKAGEELTAAENKLAELRAAEVPDDTAIAAAAEAVTDAETAQVDAAEALKMAQTAQGAAQTAYDAAKEAYDEELAKVNASDIGVAYIEAETALTEANDDAAEAETAVTAAQAAVTAAETGVTVAQVEDAIDALPTDVTEADEEAIQAARAAYNALTDEQKAQLAGAELDKLVSAENALAVVKAGLTDEDAIISTETAAADAQAIVDANETVYIMPGTYQGIQLQITGDKKLIGIGAVSFVGNGSGTAIDVQENGNLTLAVDTLAISQYDNGIRIVSPGDHTFTLETGILNCFDLTNFYGNGAFSIGGVDETNEIHLNFEEGTSFICKNSYSGIEINNNGGTISVYTKFNKCALVDLSNNGRDHSSGSGIQAANSPNIYQEITFQECAKVRLDNNHLDAINFQSSEIGTSKLNIIGCQDISMSGNNSWGTNGGIVTISDSELNISDNGSAPWDRVAATGSNLYCAELYATDSKIIADNANANCGVWVAGVSKITNCNISANESAKVRNEKGGSLGYYSAGSGYESYYRANYPYASGTGCFFGGATVIENTTINATDNAGAGVVFRNDLNADNISKIVNSTIIADNNGYGALRAGVEDHDYIYKSGIAILSGQLNAAGSYLSAVDNEKYGIVYYYDDFYKDLPSMVALDSNTVVRLRENTDAAAEIYATAGNRETYVLSGSLQGIRDNMSGTYTLNGSKAPEKVYAGPINAQKTMLTRFNLNSETGHGTALRALGNGVYSFTTYDPNATTAEGGKTYAAYDYTFRYNTAGEDHLAENESGNAYVWAPVSILHYDATQGDVVLDGSTAVSGDAVLTNTRGDGSAMGNAMMNKANIDATDYTIYGSSLWLSEGVQPGASRSGYSFAGWFVRTVNGTVDNDWLAECTDANGAVNWTAFYDGLNTQVTGDTQLSALYGAGVDLAELTVYAKWTPNGGGGGWTPPTPKPDPDPGTDIPETDVPTGDQPGTPVNPDQPVDIADPDVPLGEAPKTGDGMALWVALASVSAIGLAWLAADGKRRKTEE